MPFGINKGMEIADIDDRYLIWIAKTARGDYRRGFNRHDLPISGQLEAETRQELKKRGYTFKGQRIEKEDGDGEY